MCILGLWKVLFFIFLLFLKGLLVQSGFEIVGCIVLFFESFLSFDVCLYVYQYGFVVQLDIMEKKICIKLLLVDLVFSLEIDVGEYFVLKFNKLFFICYFDFVWR